ncbi:sensor histidine kinase [Streptomonospora wellingtoniae]|uniref:histidine kinase n=1 Tax=Streptomonospora wellingtoniae TaxID=3075544 RepID=A0ABU2KTK3_9ACTN|nr:sensor domain-containing protein [Streptomonospora sp. DSM 45055]MDT0302624.1 sensor domain-containing protein [Streptomonospora sp. DSM 45055]
MARPHYRPHTRLTLLVWSPLLTAHALAGVLLLALSLVAAALSAIWVGVPLLAALTRLLRGHANTHRRILAHLLTQGAVPAPAYRPLPDTRLTTQITTLLRDPATRRDYTWLAANSTAGLALAALPSVLLTHAALALAHTYTWRYDPSIYALQPVTTQAEAWPSLITGALLLTLAYLLTPAAIHTYARLNRRLLAPTEHDRLTARVAHLATSRAHTIDAQASEVRRIERDLHDGAQARLVALGMSLGLAEEMLTHDPRTAQTLLAEARETTRQALTELRDLVRGIHPPVLVERGLDGAVRALALTHHIPITVDIDLPGRPPGPVESAAYFAVAELLTNTAKHAAATRAWIRINHGHDRLVITVGDDGSGGLQPQAGTGLTGIRRRLSAFDGTMNTTSPAGGPTIVTMELPCSLDHGTPAPAPTAEPDLPHPHP